MITPATLKGHPIHSILVMLPIGAFLAFFVSDLVSFWIQDPVWYWLSWYNLWVGFIGGLAAVIPGLIDYLSLPKESAARRTAFIHAGLALVMLILFFISLLQQGRSTAPLQPTWKSGFLFSLIGILVMLAVGWLGGSLVYKHQVGVQPPKDVGLETFGEPRSIANIKGHPIHPMLVPIPFTLFLVSVLFDLFVLLGEDATFWERLAFYELSLSLGGAILAFFPGMIDAFHVLPMPSGQTVGKHVIAIALFFSALTISLIVRVSGLPFAWWVGFIASLIGLVFLGIGGWFGGDNVYRERIGVEKERVQTRAETLSR